MQGESTSDFTYQPRKTQNITEMLGRWSEGLEASCSNPQANKKNGSNFILTSPSSMTIGMLMYKRAYERVITQYLNSMLISAGVYSFLGVEGMVKQLFIEKFKMNQITLVKAQK